MKKTYIIFAALMIICLMGGTGWGAEFAKLCNKPLCVFDQKRNGWFIWNKLDWVDYQSSEGPIISHARFTGTGTRFLEENGRKAICELFARSFA